MFKNLRRRASNDPLTKVLNVAVNKYETASIRFKLSKRLLNKCTVLIYLCKLRGLSKDLIVNSDLF